MAHNSDRPILYHALMGVGFLGLIGWFALLRELGFMTWLTSLGPATHAGALNMLAIMLWMLPAFLAWKYYLRWLNRWLNVRGIYYEDHYYNRGSEPHPGDDGASGDSATGPNAVPRESDRTP